MSEKSENRFMGFINKNSKWIMYVIIGVVLLSVVGFGGYYYLVLRNIKPATNTFKSSVVYATPIADEVKAALKVLSTTGTVVSTTSISVTLTTDKGSLTLNVTRSSNITSGANSAITPLSSLAVGQAVSVAYDSDTKNINNLYWEKK